MEYLILILIEVIPQDNVIGVDTNRLEKSLPTLHCGCFREHDVMCVSQDGDLSNLAMLFDGYRVVASG